MWSDSVLFGIASKPVYDRHDHYHESQYINIYYFIYHFITCSLHVSNDIRYNHFQYMFILFHVILYIENPSMGGNEASHLMTYIYIFNLTVCPKLNRQVNR